MFNTMAIRNLAAVGITIATLLATAGLARGEISVPLTVTERGQDTRYDDLACGGVPLPQGAVKETGGFYILDAAGQPVPAQFDVLGRWPADGSVRWMLVQFPVRMIEMGKTLSFTLKDDGTNPKSRDTLKIEDGQEVITVDTGKIRFTVRKKNFAILDTVTMRGENGTDRVTLGPKLCGDGFVVTTTQPEQTFTMAADADSKVTLEDIGPLRATIRADGRHKSAEGTPGFAYRVRIYAIAGSPAVRAQYTFTHDTGPFTNVPVALRALALTVKPKLKGILLRQFLGMDADPVAGSADLPGEWRLSVLDSRKYAFKGWAEKQGPLEDIEAFGCGFNLTDHSQDISILGSVRWFWQLNPKALVFGPEGTMKIELVPSDAAEPAHIYRGMAKTHDVLLAFYGKESRKPPWEEMSYRFQQPLHIKCPPSWYCQDTLSLGRLASSDCPAIRPEFAKFVKTVDDGFDKQIDVIREYRSKVVDAKNGTTGYNMIHFGDGFHQARGAGHQNILWDDCYYGYTHMLAMQFARSGRDLILDTLREATTCEGDVCVAWQTLDLAAPRQNPGAYHIGGFNDNFNNIPSPTWNFYHPDGLMEAFYLTGDRRYEDAGLANYNWALQNDGYDIYNNPRSVGAGMRAMVFGYLATGNKSFLYAGREIARKAERFFRVHGDFAPVKNSIFMCPNALEGLCLFHELTGEPVLGKVLPDMVAAHVKHFVKNPANLEYAYARLYTARLTGDEATAKEVQAALAENAKFSIQTGEHNIKDFAAGKRAVPLIFWELSALSDSPAGMKPWGPIDLGPERPDRVEIPALAALKLPGANKFVATAVIDLVGTPDPSHKLAAPTRLRLGYDEKNLYLAVQATEPRLDLLNMATKQDGGPVYNDDCVEIYVGPNSRLAGLKLIVNAAGARAVAMRGHKKELIPTPAPADFPVVANQDKASWTLWVTIPWDKIGLADVAGKPGTEVAFNVIRFRVGSIPPPPTRGEEASGGQRAGPGGESSQQEKFAESSTWQGTSNQMESVGTLILGK